MSDDQLRKLIEVALPLPEISKASVADKNRKVGTIKNLHKWFAPMPTPALRALIFASLVNDPGNDNDREKLSKFIKELVPENGTAPGESVLQRARELIERDNPELPTVLDPFCGGGSTVVEAQRLGLPTVASDLNPVAVLITRVLGELLPPMAYAPAVSATLADGPDAQPMIPKSTPFEGFIADLKYYGELAQKAVKDKLNGLYPAIAQGEPVAWLWSRTIPCPNPMCGATVPLFSSPVLSKQVGREASVEAVIEGTNVHYVVHKGNDSSGRSFKVKGSRARFECPAPACGNPLGEKEIKQAGIDGTMELQLMAVCVNLPHGGGRTFLSADEVADPAEVAEIPDDLSDIMIGGNTRDFRTPLYGLNRQIDLYTPRQLAVLAAFADEVANVADWVLRDGGDTRHANAIASILGLCIGKLAQANSALVRWRIDSRNGAAKAEPAFGEQAMPMLWDFAEPYPFGKSVGSWTAQLESVIGSLDVLPTSGPVAHVMQADARKAGDLVPQGTALLVTDPPYYAQINYADLSDYFYLWIRRAMRGVHPDLFATMATPKEGELVANPARYGGSREKARKEFIAGFTEVFKSLTKADRPDLPIVVVYAHKQDEEMVDGIISTGWASLLEAVLAADLGVVRTWPVEAASTTKQIGQGANALSTYVILICRPRRPDLPSTDRRGFLDALGVRLPGAIKEFGHVPAVDLSQAAIGPGMEVFSGFSQVIESDGSRMSVATALALINDKLQGILWDQEAEFDPETRAAVAWYDEYDWQRGDSGRAEQIAMGKNTSIPRLVTVDIMWSKGGDTRLLRAGEMLAVKYDGLHARPTVWVTALLVSDLLENGRREDAVRLLASVRSHVQLDAIVDLARLMFTLGEKRKRTDDQLRFNNLVTEWPELAKSAREYAAQQASVQPTLDEVIGHGG
jgi:putative DNA methylase